MRSWMVCLLVACASHVSPPPHGTAPKDECGSGDPWTQIAVYCRHVADRCCGSAGGWNCDNVNYIEWYGKYCKP